MRDENGDRLRNDLTDAEARALKSSVVGYWNTPVIAGNVYTIVNWFVPSEYVVAGDPSSGLKWVEKLIDKWPTKIILIGAWNRDGAMFGTTIDKVENGVDSFEVMNRVVTMTDLGNTTWDITDPLNPVEIPLLEEVVTYEGTGQFVDLPHYDDVVTGAPVYPLHPQYMKIFPDVDGAPAVVPAEVCTMSGWAERRWA